jgi:hypothetical protein
MAKVSNLKVDLQKGSDNTLYASWSFKKKHIDHFAISWYYFTGNNVWFSGSSSNVTVKNATYSVPSNATKVKVTVKPVSEKKSKKEKNKTIKVPYWKGVNASKQYQMSKTPPETPSTPTVSVNGYKLSAILDTQDSLTDAVEFYIISGNKKIVSSIVSLNKTSRRASYSYQITPGSKYRVRCRAVNYVGSGKKKSKVYSGWSEYSSEVTTIPDVNGGVVCSVESDTSVKVSWDKNKTAASYEVQYTTNRSYFDSSSEVSSVAVEVPYAYITGLDTGYTYYFRVRSVNDQGESGWSTIVSVVLGSTPTAPTTWSSTTTAVVGESVILYWVHNCEDGSKQSGYEVEITVNGVADVKSEGAENNEETYSYPLDLSMYKDGADILWRVRTKGVTDSYGEWSVQREIKLYAMASLGLQLGSDDKVLRGFPYTITAEAGPQSQKPMGYHISITANESYETNDEVGETVWVNEGEEIYSKRVDDSEHSHEFNLSAGDIYLENDKSYKVIVTVSMDSGLTAESNDIFTVEWNDDRYEPDVSIVITEALTANISPVCRRIDDELEELVEGVTLSVYRREYDGSFTEIASGLENDGSVTVVDPHPSLYYAGYRVVVLDLSNGTVDFEDFPGEPVLESSIVIQWNESWRPLDFSEEDAEELPTLTASMVKLPYNVDITENHDPDVALVEYTGRRNPVSYYGTQRGESATWSAEIDKEDMDTISALRRLSTWAGDVYVREPSGIGYWAQVTVSMTINHCELTVPVTLTIKRVEGSGV